MLCDVTFCVLTNHQTDMCLLTTNICIRRSNFPKDLGQVDKFAGLCAQVLHLLVFMTPSGRMLDL